jgi:thiol-disulfide isomerase/thioredoxin
VRTGRAAISALALAQTIAVTGCAHQGPRADMAVPGGAAEPLSFEVKRWPGGESFDVAGERGHVVLLDVWATWCEPCRDALPGFERLAREYAPRGVEVFALNVDEDSRQVASFVGETKVSLPILVDQNAAVAEKTLKVRLMPTTFILDRRGVVRFVHEGFAGDSMVKIRSELEHLLDENPGAQ